MCVCLMFEVKTWVFLSVCLMFELKPWNISVCMPDVCGEGVGYMCVYV